MRKIELFDEAVREFEQLPDLSFDSYEEKFHYVVSQMHKLCYGIKIAEDLGVAREDIKKKLGNAWEMHSKSKFFNRLQNWPRGYQGDFETIEYICDGKIQVEHNSIEYFLEWHCLNSAIAQQHRNKVNIQSRKIQDLAVQKKKVKILLVGCGGGRDIINIQNTLINQDVDLYLNDIDPDAIAHIKAKFKPDALEKITFICGNVLNLVRNKSYNGIEFDLILFGGVFDYLPDKVIKIVFKHMYFNMLSKDGKILFTNIKIHNPFRVWIEYLANWHVIERDEQDCINLCKISTIPEELVDIYPDETGLTLITEISKNLQRGEGRKEQGECNLHLA